MKQHPELTPELEINEGSKNLKAFFQMGIPSCKIFLNNVSGSKFYSQNKTALRKFLKDYAPQVKSLRVKELSLFIKDQERLFFEGFANLESLEAGHWKAPEMKVGGVTIKVRCLSTEGNICALPSTFLRLKSVKIGENPEDPTENLVLCTMPYFRLCWDLEFISFPFNVNIAPIGEAEGLSRSRNAMAIAFASIYKAIEDRQGRNANFKVIDFENYHNVQQGKKDIAVMELYGSSVFLTVCTGSLENGIKLRNVGANWFKLRETCDVTPEIGSVVLSLVNIMPWVFSMDMPNLEKINVMSTSRCSTILLPGQSRPLWPKLKCLEICVDSKTFALELADVIDDDGTLVQSQASCKTKDLFNFFFKGISRVALVELCLKFQENVEVAIPQMEDIADACPNLKRLRIVNWPGTNKALVKLWNKLPALEEISLENCKQLGNVAFVGEDSERPVFFKLKNLKKLSLKGLDQMPKITDTLFSLVIRHLKLTHFILTSNEPVKSVTPAGIEALLSGCFAESIEKFPFCGWSLANVTMKKFQGIEKKFRSYNIL